MATPLRAGSRVACGVAQPHGKAGKFAPAGLACGSIFMRDGRCLER